MQTLFEFAKHCRQSRDIYDQRYADHNQATRDAEKVAMQRNNNSIPLSREELDAFGAGIDAEYNLIPKEEIKRSPYDHCTPGWISQITNMSYFERENVPGGPFLLSDETDPGKNCQNRYYESVNKIKSFDIDIYDVKKILSAYKDRTWSSCLGGTDVYIFYCGKNNYTFDITFSDDCDCIPGMLLVGNLINTRTNETHNMHCDLFCQNAGESELANFLFLISNQNYDDYMEQRFGHFLRLPELFKQSGFIVSHAETPIDSSTQFNIFDLAIGLSTNDERCLIVPFDKNGGYALYICPALNQIDIKLRKIFNKLDHYTFRHFMFDKSLELNYASDDDFPTLILYIEAYFNYHKGYYGYVNADGIFQNESIIESYIAGLKNDDLTFTKTSSNHDGNYFDVNIIFCNGRIHDVAWNYLSDVTYLLDLYKINFSYDEKKNKDKCFLRIQGKYHDMSVVASEYQKKEDFLKIDYFRDVKDILPMVDFAGTFDDCYAQITMFVETLIATCPVARAEREARCDAGWGECDAGWGECDAGWGDES